MNKFLYRRLYNAASSRRLRVAALAALRLARRPVYRVAVDTNNLCNLRCIMCYMSLDEFRNKARFMDMGLFERLAREAFPKTRVLDMSCSYEPFMTKNFVEYLRIARRSCPGQIGICTNATLMKESDAEAIVGERLLDEVSVSIDGLTKETFEDIRAKGDFDKALRGFELIRDARAAHKSRGPLVRMNYTMMGKNIGEVEGLFDFAQKYGVDVVQLRHAHLTREFQHLYEDSLFYRQEESDQALRQVAKDFERDKSKTLIHPPLFSDAGRSFVCERSQCAYAWFNFRVFSDGDIRLCGMGSIGNVSEGFEKVVHSPKVQEIRQRLLAGDYKELCGGCHVVSDVGDMRERETFIKENAPAFL